MKRYIITTFDGHFVGLFNFGRTYMSANKPCIIKETPERAQMIAATFGGELIELP